MVATETARPRAVHPTYDGPPDGYDGACPVCGRAGYFERDRLSISESFRCAGCQGALRYQGQARGILRAVSRHGARSVAELAAQPGFGGLDIFEPGTLGPFRPLLRPIPGYVQSFFDPATPPGEVRDGLRCENLMDLTFADASFDLVITSDIFEHVRHPARGFAEVFRILRPGGWHVFTIPGRWPLRRRTVARVDVSGPGDVHWLPAVYHNHDHLVYNDFGRDLFDLLDGVGFVTEPLLFASASPTTSVQVTFCSMRPEDPPGPEPAPTGPEVEPVTAEPSGHRRRVRR